MKRFDRVYIRLLSVLLIATLLFSLFFTVSFAESAKEQLKLSARSAALYEANTGTFLYTKNADECLGMASTTKIASAIVAIEMANLDEKVYITNEMTGIEGSSLYLKEGEELTVKDLLYGLLLRSANDAAVALSVHLCGSVEKFVDKMNSLAATLSLGNTHFDNPHGLDGATHYTTAKELALLASYASQNEVFREIVSTKKTIICKGEENARLIVNHNRLLSMYEDADGIKTGFTKKCGRTLVGSASRGGMHLICVTLDAPNDWSDHQKLFDYGFEQYKNTEALRPLAYRRELCVLGGTEGSVYAYNAVGSSHLEQSHADAYTLTVTLPKMVVAPIQKGQQLGEILVEYADGTTERIPLLAEKDVKQKRNRLFF